MSCAIFKRHYFPNALQANPSLSGQSWSSLIRGATDIQGKQNERRDRTHQKERVL